MVREIMPEQDLDLDLPEGWTPPPTDLIFDDGEPLETNRHRIAINVLIRSAEYHLSQLRTDFFVGGNMFIYFNRVQAKNRDFRGPDFFVALDVDGSKERQGWVIWDEDGRYPDVIIELLSNSTANKDRGEKKDVYERTFRTTDYFIFDPFDPNSLEGWHLVDRRYQPLVANDRHWLWCASLGLWLGVWQGAIDREPATGSCSWLRFYDRDGNLVPLPEEAALQQTEVERQRAEEEHQRAEEERQRAEEEHQRAEEERQRAEEERQRADRLAARLRQLGENPEML